MKRPDQRRKAMAILRGIGIYVSVQNVVGASFEVYREFKGRSRAHSYKTCSGVPRSLCIDKITSHPSYHESTSLRITC